MTTYKNSGEGAGFFTRFTSRTSKVLGHAWIFAAAVAVLVLWACTGPLLSFSNTWQLVINTGTTIVTFLMVFIIQNTQNRDSAALHLKLDAVMHELRVTNSKLYEAEDESEDELERQRRHIEAQSEEPPIKDGQHVNQENKNEEK